MGTQTNTLAYPAGVLKIKKKITDGLLVKKVFSNINDKLGCSSTLITFNLVL